jgi:hypothetical protein
VISEAAPIDQLLRAHFRDAGITENQRMQWLQWLVQILSWRRHPLEKNVFIKFDCWHALFLPLIQRAFPAVPWIFVYREPLEVMVSHHHHRGGQMVPGVLEPALFGWDAETIGRVALNEYGARVLGKICEAALAQVQNGNGKLVNYQQLPGAIWPELMKFWRVEYSGDERERMFCAAKWHAKNPVLPFEADGQAKRNSAPAELRALTQPWLAGVYQQLEAQRAAVGFV